jgi:hypothetical protein
MTETLNWKSWCELPAIEGIDRGQSRAFLDQFCKFVGCFFDLTKYFFRIFFGVSYDDRKRVILGTELVMDIRKIANDLVAVEASGKLGSRIWPSEQRHVKVHSIGAIDERSLFRDSPKCFSAVSALLGVSLQRITAFTTPLIAETVTERSAVREEGRSQTSDVRSPTRVPKYPFPATSQLYETAGAAKTAFGVRKRVDFRTGVAH